MKQASLDKKGQTMSKRYTYDCILTKEDDGYVAQFPQIEGAYCEGDTREETLKNASDVLTLCLLDDFTNKWKAPKYERVAEVVSVSVEVTNEDEEQSHYMTQADASEMLNVTPSRISHLISNGQLDSKYFDGRRLVSIASVNEYENTPRKAGRPYKIAV